MKKQIGYGLFLLTLLASTFSCEGTDGDDKELPVIDSVSFSSKNVSLGDTMYIGYRFQDNEYLSTYRVKIDSTFTNSDETKILYTKKIIKSFSFGDERKIASRRDTIIIPKTMNPKVGNRLPVAEGKYLVTISCIDRSGNEAVEYTDTLILNPAKEIE